MSILFSDWNTEEVIYMIWFIRVQVKKVSLFSQICSLIFIYILLFISENTL